MARYKVECPNCNLNANYFFPSEKERRVIACPNCHRGVQAVKINDKNTTLVDKDGIVGVFVKEQSNDKQRRGRARRV